MRIIHLSDLHISKQFKRDNIKKFKACLKHITQFPFDHLVITGDLSENGNPDEFKIIRQILKNYDLLDSAKVSIVIGNHDIFGGVQTAADIIDFPYRCKNIDYESKVSNFVHHFEELFVDCEFTSPRRFFPYYKNLNQVGLMGINSIDVYSKLKNPMASTGKVYSSQLNDIKKLCENNAWRNKPTLVLIHHHFYKKNMIASSPQNKVWNKIESYTLRLRNRKRLISLINKCGINLVLHGHSHEIKQYTRKGIHFLNAGGSIENENGDLSYFVITHENNECNIEVKNISFNKQSSNPILKLSSQT